MPALQTIGQRQQNLLKALLRHRSGLTVDDLARELSISRNAVNQHIASLEGNGFIESVSLTSTRGRPGKVYTLTQSGLELFPRHYAMFANLLIRTIRQQRGEQELKSCLAELGQGLAGEFAGRVQKNASFTGKIDEVAVIMHELGYEARVGEGNEIIASNCVFHQLAQECAEVCELDLALLAGLLDAGIEHRECMVRGGRCCRFGIVEKP